MHTVDISTLSPGQRVPCDVYDSNGNLMLQAEQTIEQSDLIELQDRAHDELFYAEEPIVMTPDTEPLEDHVLTVSELRIGQALRGDIVDANGVLLLARGAVITERFIERLKARGIKQVTERSDQTSQPAPQSENSTHHRPTRARVEKKYRSDSPHNIKWDADLAAMLGVQDRTLPLHELHSRLMRGRCELDAAVSETQQILNDILSGGRVSGRELASTLRGLTTTVQADKDLALLLLQFKSKSPDYLYEHSVCTALTAMRVAAQLHHTENDVVDLGLAALLQDVGMLRVPEEIRFASRSLERTEQQIIEQHPDHSVSMLENITGLRSTVKAVVFQGHERMDGSGYPRRRSGMFIHPLARVLGPVDTYVALTPDRPHRKAKLPHHAIMHLLGQTKQGRFDKTVITGMLECLSLYPVGSFVRLSTDKVAQVLRGNPTHLSQPLVAEVQPDGTLAKRERDLTRCRTTTIVEAVAPPDTLPIAA